jgi:hypothetical protein
MIPGVPEIVEMQACGADRPDDLRPGRHPVEVAAPQWPTLGTGEDERFGLWADEQGQVLSQNGSEGLRDADDAAGGPRLRRAEDQFSG